MFASRWLAKISCVCKPHKIIPFLFVGIGPFHHAQEIDIHMIWFGWSSGVFAQSAATLQLKSKHYFTLSYIFPSPGDVSVTAKAAPAIKRWTHPPACYCPQLHPSLLSRSKMPLPPPMLWSLLFWEKGVSVLFKNSTKIRTAEIDFFSYFSFNHKLKDSQGILKIEVIVAEVVLSLASHECIAQAARAKPKHTSCPNQATPGSPDR